MILLGIDQTKKELMENVDHYHDVKFLSDAEVALHARNENIDIAIDLKGFTLQTRIGIFAYRFAPIQISYLDIQEQLEQILLIILLQMKWLYLVNAENFILRKLFTCLIHTK